MLVVERIFKQLLLVELYKKIDAVRPDIWKDYEGEIRKMGDTVRMRKAKHRPKNLTCDKSWSHKLESASIYDIATKFAIKIIQDPRFEEADFFAAEVFIGPVWCSMVWGLGKWKK